MPGEPNSLHLERPKKLDPFVQVDLATLDWTPRSALAGYDQVSTTELPLPVPGEHYQLIGEQRVTKLGMDFKWLVMNTANEPEITGELNVTTGDRWTAMTSIAKHGGPLKALGLDRQILQHIQSLANQHQREITHGAYHSEEGGVHGQTVLPIEQWEQIFVPFLREQGYREQERGSWIKTYQPQTSE